MYLIEVTAGDRKVVFKVAKEIKYGNMVTIVFNISIALLLRYECFGLS